MSLWLCLLFEFACVSARGVQRLSWTIFVVVVVVVVYRPSSHIDQHLRPEFRWVYKASSYVTLESEVGRECH